MTVSMPAEGPSINRIYEALLQAMERLPSADGAVFACHATEDEWDAFVVREDEDPPLNTKYLEWFETTRAIHLIEFPSAAHESLIAAMICTFDVDANANRWLVCRGGSANQEGSSVHRMPTSDQTHARLAQFAPIKVEIGVLQQWGDRAGPDHKAVVVWRDTPGPEYVLCIKTDLQFATAEYKLYDFQVRGSPREVTPIGPGTTAAGIPAAAPLPTGFPDPMVVDIYAALEKTRAGIL